MKSRGIRPVRAAAVIAIATAGVVVFSASSACSAREGTSLPRRLVLIDAKTGTVDTSFPDVDRDIYGVSSDGRGGWYVAGAFRKVGNGDRPALAHLLKDGSLDTAFAPALSYPERRGVTRVLYRGGVVYAGGKIGVLAFNAATGTRLWNARIRGNTGGNGVMGLSFGEGRLFVGGNFNQISGVTRRGLAALDPRSGMPTAWQVELSYGSSEPSISTLSYSRGTVYLAGGFDTVAGAKRTLGLAAVSARTGRPTAWSPLPTGPVANFTSIDSMLVTRGQVLLGAYRGGFAVLNARSAKNLAWAKRLVQTGNALSGPGHASSFAVSGNTVYIGATGVAPFNTAGGKPANNLASVVLPSGRFTSWRPQVSRCTDVVAMVISGRKILAGGGFHNKTCIE